MRLSLHLTSTAMVTLLHTCRGQEQEHILICAKELATAVLPTICEVRAYQHARGTLRFHNVHHVLLRPVYAALFQQVNEAAACV